MGLDQSRVLQNLHVVRDRRLGQLDALLDVGGGPALRGRALAWRAGLQQTQNLAPGRIGDGAQRQAQLVGCSLHDGSFIIRDSSVAGKQQTAPRALRL